MPRRFFWSDSMVPVEVFGADDDADEDAAIDILREAKGLDDYHAEKPFGLLYWHKRPFTIHFTTADEADDFMEQLQACGYQSRVSPLAGIRSDRRT
jgi:hypothetical protein